uniref:orotate phosphoribosyltransferase n=1 Tax=Lygus hesperus TaxID=30085 RepID=A0A0A9XLL2_LYGHE
MKLVAREYAKVLGHYQFDRIVGLPYAALPIASAISLEMNVPLIYPRREAKAYGTKAAIEGEYKAGERVVIIDDLVSTGETKVEAIDKLKSVGLKIVAIVVLIDREMGAKKFLNDLGYEFEAVVGLYRLLPMWRQLESITQEQANEVKQFLGQYQKSKL